MQIKKFHEKLIEKITAYTDDFVYGLSQFSYER